MAVIKSPDGRAVEVTEDNKLEVFAISQHEDKFKNTEGRYWSIFVSVTPAAPGDNFFYLTNTGSDDLFITDIRISSSVINQFLYKKVTGTPVGGTAAAVTSRNLGNPKLPTATILEAAAITGLTDDGVLLFEEIEVANKKKKDQMTSNIIIPQGQAVAFEASASGIVTAIISLAVVEQ
jgi:hypothetical protein